MRAEGVGLFDDEAHADQPQCRPQCIVAGTNGLTRGHTDSMQENQIRFFEEEKKSLDKFAGW